ncbi:MAG: hypothetical protein VYE00_15455 [Candidatus Poribacteria bacterium]|nr:hypothetical protein [Candidatus Poribacteria bacterium]
MKNGEFFSTDGKVSTTYKSLFGDTNVQYYKLRLPSDRPMPYVQWEIVFDQMICEESVPIGSSD